MDDLIVEYRIRTDGEYFKVERSRIFTEVIGKGKKKQTEEKQQWDELGFWLGAAFTIERLYRLSSRGTKTLFKTEVEAVDAVIEAFGASARRVREWRTI